MNQFIKLSGDEGTKRHYAYEVEGEDRKQLHADVAKSGRVVFDVEGNTIEATLENLNMTHAEYKNVYENLMNIGVMEYETDDYTCLIPLYDYDFEG